MASTEEEWDLRVMMSGGSDVMKMASSLTTLDAAQLKTAQSNMALNKAMQSASPKAATAPIAMKKASPAKLDVAATSTGGDPFKAANASADKLISKKGAIKETLGAQLGNISSAAQSAGGPLGAIAGKLQQIGGIVGKVPPQVAAAIVVFVALTAVITVTTAAIYKMGEAALSVIAQRNQLLATFGALSGGGTGGAKTLAIVERLGTALPFATAKIAEWATGLQKAGLQGRSLESAIKAVAAAEALIAGGGAAAQSLISTLALGGANAMQLIATLKRGGPEARAQLAEMGLRVEDIAAALNMTTAQFKNARLSAKQMAEAVEKALARKAAGPLADLFLTFPVLIQRVREGFLSLFDKLGPAVRPFMQAVKKLFDSFSKGGAVINALKPIVTSVMSTLFGWATKAVGVLSAIVGWFLRSVKAGGVFGGAIAVIKVVWATLAKVFGLAIAALKPMIALLIQVFTNAYVLKGIATIFTLIAVWIGAAVVAVFTFGAVVATVVGYVVGIFAALLGAVAGVGGAIVDGLVGGMDIGAFVAKMAAMAGAGLAAFKGIFGIASPSKVMLQHGEKNIAGAAATGVEKGADKMDASMERLGPEGAGGKGGKGKDGGRERPNIDLRGSTFIDCTEEFIRDTIHKVLEEWAREGPTPEPQG